MISSLLTGCLNEHEKGLTTWSSIIWDSRVRFYAIHIPDSYNDTTPVPLVIALHGGGGNAKSMEDKTGFNNLSDEKGFIVAYPEGTGKFKHIFLTWNAGYCCGYALENNIDDVGFIRELIKTLEGKYNIDSNRIYITGHSNGAMLTYRLGAELSDIVAAIAPVAGSIGGYATNDSQLCIIPEPKYPVSVIAIHGRLDSHVPYDGGHGTNATGGRIDLSVNESISFWVEHDMCNPIPEVEKNGNITITRYTGGRNNTEVVLYTIENGEHWWPSSDKDPYKELSASEIIWDFFENHSKGSF
ncbi:MAG: polyhydroxybutyrate depolymerase [Thermoplasmata archaeon]|nr:MAG: polyhydroxybutyrate depolymerase [Thermoplasmata archaeon]